MLLLVSTATPLLLPPVHIARTRSLVLCAAHDELWDEEQENRNMVKDAIFNLASFVMEMDTFHGPYLIWTQKGADLVEMFGQKDTSVLEPKRAVAMAR